jgi:hypothetical protein
MDIVQKDVTTYFNFKYPISHDTSWLRNRMDHGAYYTHDKLAEIIAENKFKTYMAIAVCDRLGDEHWDDPLFIHKTNHLVCSELREMARREITNKYFSQSELDALILKKEFPLTEFNYKEDEDRAFKRRIEDEIFNYQEQIKMFQDMTHILDDANYKLDDEGYIIETDDGDFIPETDPDIIEEQKRKLLERFFMPRVTTTCDRVYNMPEPFNYWDYRSSYHQAFYVELHDEEKTYVDMGGGGSSGRRESNGRWAHTFGLLATKYGIETPTFFMRYDKHNIFSEDFRLDTFATLGRDLSGNYSSTRDVMAPLFKGRIYEAHTNESSLEYRYTYEKREDDLYY